ncbi:mitochondrial carrier domain-containing protein [Immersiella caudata]|uniref:Mitochondrial carrier domain-containing protein n=1 Tax=Immersiella caudata TaxID=314043 RepID=A0AA39W4C2_9PEZI|nr:mitochondrial carrier domain-containing protein [Immersiella caudata]
MSADFWAGYISGAIGIIIGNPLDVLKVRLQASSSSQPTSPVPSISPSTPSPTSTLRPFLTGTAAPILGYGALNALLFISYNRSEAALNSLFPSGPNPSNPNTPTTGSNLYTTFLAGCLGGLATWVVSTPTELIKCRAQLSPSRTSSWSITRRVLHREGIKGLYFGGGVTAIRDSIGYGLYFWGYELSSRIMASTQWGKEDGPARVLLCGGIAGVLSWASIFPLDVTKTRVQTQTQVEGRGEGEALVGKKRMGAWAVARETYKEGGIRPFFRGLGVCSVRAFVVNAVQWAVYEWIMMQLGAGRQRGKGNESSREVTMG